MIRLYMAENAADLCWETDKRGQLMSRRQHCYARSPLALVSYFLQQPRSSETKCRGEIYSESGMKIRHARAVLLVSPDVGCDSLRR